METLMLRTSVTRSFVKKAFLLLAVAYMATTSVYANTHPGDEISSVYCLRVENNQVYFMVKYANESGQKFDVIVNDESGENLYRGTFSGKDFNKVFKAPADNGKLVIIIRAGKAKDDQKFEIKSEAKTIQQAYVKRM